MAVLQAALLVGAVIVTVSSGLVVFGRAGPQRITALFRDSEKPRQPAVNVAAAAAVRTVRFARSANIAPSERYPALKRFIDCSASLALLVALAPVVLVTAIAIKLDSPGPILYRQKRIGFAGRTIEVFKFRSMVVDAEKDGPQYAKANDSRVTRVGRIIRKLRIDEIPQTINVLRGEMSFVGPRPERPEFVALLEREIDHYHDRHAVKPGITGWAQVKYEYAASVEGAREKLRFDLYYIRHFTPLLDILIILMTVRVALFGIGSR